MQQAGRDAAGFQLGDRQHSLGAVGGQVFPLQPFAAALLGNTAQKRVVPINRRARDLGIGIASTRPRSSSRIPLPEALPPLSEGT